MASRVLWLVANWSVCITACIGVLWMCFEVVSLLVDSIVKHWGFYNVMIDWITYRKDFKAWLDDRDAARSDRGDGEGA